MVNRANMIGHNIFVKQEMKFTTVWKTVFIMFFFMFFFFNNIYQESKKSQRITEK